MASDNSDKNPRASLHIEDAEVDAEVQKEDAHPHLKLDERGLPLVPQPSDHKDDPLVPTQFLSRGVGIF